ncbi:MAG: DUF1731 domain-containing protein [Myxococcales bacterium]|nr:DUF1731 domain-containing protein [Myxococcales bacterium]
MRYVIPGGTGQVGAILTRGLRAAGHEVLVIGRSVADPALRWDGRTVGPWMDALDGADVVVSLAGRSVDCRYGWENLELMMRSRVEAALAVGQAIAQVPRPPGVWLQASTASIYPHTLTDTFDESASIGPRGDGAPGYWSYSVSIARAWELAQQACPTPHTRKVAMRLGFTMSPGPGGIFDVLLWLVRVGLGGPFRSGRQSVSWLGDRDLVRAVEHLAMDGTLEGPVNLTAPEPIPNAELMAGIREAAGVPFGLPILPGMDRAGAWLLDTDVELMHKSRRVVPRRLLEAGFTFVQHDWRSTAADLVTRADGRRVAVPMDRLSRSRGPCESRATH